MSSQTPPMQTVPSTRMRLSRYGLGLLMLLIVGGTAYEFYPSLRLFALFVAGHSPTCPLSHAIKSTANAEAKFRVKDRILAASRLVKEESGLELWDTPKGQFWIPKGGRYILPFNLAEMELHIYGSDEHFVHPGDIVLDCGASDGDFTREALKAGAKLVVAIEVFPPSAECVRRNLAAEIAQGRVIVYPKGVWDQDDMLTLNVDDNNFGANSVAMRPLGAHPAGKVPLTTIDKIVEDLHLPRVDFIKMDVEGAEVRAIAGATGTLRRFKPRLAIATEHKPDDEYTIPAAVRKIDANYQMECGPCLEANGHVRPDVLYFW